RHFTRVNCFAAERDHSVNHVFGGREPVARHAEGCFHHKRVSMTPFGVLRGPARTQLEIASVKECVVTSENKALGRTKDMPGRYQHYIDAANRSSFSKWQRMLSTRSRQPGPHQACCALGNDHLLVRRDVVAMRVGNERETFCVARV